ncbi:hypothetical protein TNIN_193091 [Trichonephila inaurata madagascariensis]|uniref:Uncharacterized protein n=1 Tax=Trichonephila inaurata madagascariensis TaxID=2747483 RepID=A0A8X6YE25_9ARAC|nr:hypothetical protein TNIN_193091 [Trichonephila inaurata madagascariensis]
MASTSSYNSRYKFKLFTVSVFTPNPTKHFVKCTIQFLNRILKKRGIIRSNPKKKNQIPNRKCQSRFSSTSRQDRRWTIRASTCLRQDITPPLNSSTLQSRSFGRRNKKREVNSFPPLSELLECKLSLRGVLFKLSLKLYRCDRYSSSSFLRRDVRLMTYSA